MIDVDTDVDLFGDLAILPSNGPYRACYGLLWWLIGDTKQTY